MFQWSFTGPSDKLGNPAWAPHIRQLIQTRAREQQARAVGAVVEATARARAWEHTHRTLGPVASGTRPPIPEGLLGGSGSTGVAEFVRPVLQLQVINGMPSSIYSRHITGTGGSPNSPPDAEAADVYGSSVVSGDTPALIANLSRGFFDGTGSARLAAEIRAAVEGPPAIIEPAGGDHKLPRKPPPLSPASEAVRERESSLVMQEVDHVDMVVPIFRVIHPSLPTLEKAMSVALYFESFYSALLHPPPPLKRNTDSRPLLSRDQRLAYLEQSFAAPENQWMSEGEKDARRDDFAQAEHERLRQKRKKVDVRSFEMGRVIGHGAFGVVRIGREKEGERLVAVKQLRKVE